jgi:hypothetical protein
MLTTVFYIVLIVVFVLTLGYVAERRLDRSGRIIFLLVGIILTVVRVCALWFLQYREWTNTQSISYFPLIVLLLPEGLLAQYLLPEAAGPARRAWDVLLFSELLVTGSFAVAYLVAFGNHKITYLKSRRAEKREP